MVSEAPRPDQPVSGRRRRSRLRIVLLVLGGIAAVGLAFVVSGVLVARDAPVVQQELTAAADQVQVLRTQVLAGDSDAAAGTLAALQDHASVADSTASSPHWWLLAHAPAIGPTVSAVRVVASVTNDLATDALPALTDALRVVNPETLAPKDGRIDLEPLIEVAPTVIAADLTVQASAQRLDRIDSSSVLGPVAEPVEELRTMLADVAMTTATASRAVQLLPSMLGADGVRRYLLLVQNPAEIRAGGGMPGALVLLTADHGRLEFTDTYTANGYRFDPPILPLTAEERNIYTDRLGVYMSGVTFTPDFPRTAEMASAMVAAKEGVVVDGVLSVDPVALQGILGATGPVTLPDGRVLDGANAAGVLMNEVYLTIEDPQEQDAYFADSARAVFDALTRGAGSSAAAMDTLAQSAREGRLRAWSAADSEQALLSGTVLSGELLGERDGSPEVGVYFNDGTAAKLGYYLRYAIQGERTSCKADGTRVVHLQVTMTNTAPANAADLPSSILGEYGVVAPGVLRTNLMLYGPTGGWIGTTDVGSYRHGEQHVVVKTVELAPGESQAFEFDVLTGIDQEGPLRLNVTPGAVSPDVVLSDYPCP